jgi:hypothetical protein
MSANIELFVKSIPISILGESGKIFYSGRAAFSLSSPAPLYILGVNPGGDPDNDSTENIDSHTQEVLHDLPSNWSAYRDESWEGAIPGTYGMAPRILHLLRQLRLEPGLIPASNLIFVRSRREAHIRSRQTMLADMCWPFHALVIEKLRPRVILCLGKTAGNYVRRKIGASRVIDRFVEKNNRRWTSHTYENTDGGRVVVATHPSIANWCAEATDPTQLVQKALL